MIDEFPLAGRLFVAVDRNYGSPADRRAEGRLEARGAFRLPERVIAPTGWDWRPGRPWWVELLARIARYWDRRLTWVCVNCLRERPTDEAGWCEKCRQGSRERAFAKRNL